jgi:2-phospho-L-lactate guanylyltransferase
MKCWAIVPLKRLSAAKSRLARELSPRERNELMCGMLGHILSALEGLKWVRGTIVVGRDRVVRNIAAGHGSVFLREKEHDGLNRALARAAREAVRRGADAIMVVPADLPRLKKSDVAGALRRAGKPPFLVIAPDRLGSGTNMLMMSPPGIIRFSFGRRSFRRHVSAGRRAGVSVKIIKRVSLAEDLDSPEDLARMSGLFSAKAMKENRKSAKKT